MISNSTPGPEGPGHNLLSLVFKRPDMDTGCIICGSALEYLDADYEMTCAVCGKKFADRVRCADGHYVCNECHMSGLDSIVPVCRKEVSKDPSEILDRLMRLPFCHMHGPEHHVLVAASLLTAYRNAGGIVDFDKALTEIVSRGKAVPGGICGYWGTCGAAVSSGIFISVVTGSTPLAKEAFGLSNTMTSRSLQSIGSHGGPRCCKRDSFLSLIEAVRFVKENLGIEMELGEIVCGFSEKNPQCLRSDCPFHRR